MVDVLDDTFVRRGVGAVRAATAGLWPGWLPGLELVPVEDRGPKGVRWSAREGRGRRAGRRGGAPLEGTAEVWLEPVPGGTVVHLYVRLDPPVGDPAPRRARDLPDRLRRTWKRGLHRWKDSLEGDQS